jgi:hypothetical protein
MGPYSPIAAKRSSRKLGFRSTQFSETRGLRTMIEGPRSLALGSTPELCKLAVEPLRIFKEGSVPYLLVP